MNQISEKQLDHLLSDLCSKLGFCLSPLVISRLTKFPPKTPQKYAKAVIEAEGFTLETIDKHLYNQILAEIEAVFNG